MFITREGDYAIRVVRALADGTRRQVGDICVEEHVPQPYAYKILKKLEGAGLVKGYRGASGGYELIKPLELLTLYDVLVSVEEELHINSCLLDGYDCPNHTPGNHCKVHIALEDIQAQLVRTLRSQSLAELLRES